MPEEEKFRIVDGVATVPGTGLTARRRKFGLQACREGLKNKQRS
jgi:hypothetical protein